MPQTIEQNSGKRADATDEKSYEAISFRPLPGDLPILKEIMAEEDRVMSNLVRVLIREALVARGRREPLARFDARTRAGKE